MSQKVDLTTLPPQQLNEIKQQFQQEFEHLTASLQALLQAQQKFADCVSDIKKVSTTENGKTEILVPLTSSLYVPGVVKDNSKFLVDVGTGYYVEKTADKSIQFYQKKIDKLKKDLVELEKLIQTKSVNIQSIDQVLQAKIIEYSKNRKAQKA